MLNKDVNVNWELEVIRQEYAGNDISFFEERNLIYGY